MTRLSSDRAMLCEDYILSVSMLRALEPFLMNFSILNMALVLGKYLAVNRSVQSVSNPGIGQECARPLSASRSRCSALARPESETYSIRHSCIQAVESMEE